MLIDYLEEFWENLQGFSVEDLRKERNLLLENYPVVEEPESLILVEAELRERGEVYTPAVTIH